MKVFQYEDYDQYLRNQKEHERTKNRTIQKSYENYINNVRVAFPSAKKILCVGARDASEVLAFRTAGYDAIGIDLYTSDQTIIKVIDMQEMTNYFNENEFDVVFSCHSLEHAYDPIRVLKSIRRVAAQGCFLILPTLCNPTGKDPIVYDFMDVIKNDVDKAKEISHTNLIPNEFSNLMSSDVSLNFYDFVKDSSSSNHEHCIGLTWHEASQILKISNEDIVSSVKMLQQIPDKAEWKTTTTHIFKLNVIQHLANGAKKKIVEFGAAQGHTTCFISPLADCVFSIDIEEKNCDKIKNMNIGNVCIVHGDLYSTEFEEFIRKYHFDVAIIDAMHEYDYIKKDIANAVATGANCFIFDDYGAFNDVKKAVNEFIDDMRRSGKKVETQYIGAPPGSLFPNTLFQELIDWEGIIVNIK